MSRARAASRRRAREGGYSLVFFALFLVGIMAIATLVVDMALARVTQDQMQTATDAALLAGFRTSDDVAAHSSASYFAGLAFSDPSGETQIGEGPLVGVTPGFEAFHASETVTSAGLYQPPPVPLANDPALSGILQPNLGNATEGDVVSGDYADDGTTPLNQLERPDYTRADFSAYGTANPPPSSALMRLRRVNSVLGAPNPQDNEPTVSSSGPALALLFGHGSFVHGQDEGNPALYSPMRDGIAVRATAIASLRTATAVGWPNATMVGAAPFAVSASVWAPGATVTFDGVSVLGSYDFVDPRITVPMVGAQIVGGTPPVPLGGPFDAYVPIFTSVDGSSVIVGFVYVTVTPQSATTATLTLKDTIGENASASVYVGFAWAGTGTATQSDLQQAVVTAFSPGAGQIPDLLQAPALVR